jgi:hypothetical protein
VIENKVEENGVEGRRREQGIKDNGRMTQLGYFALHAFKKPRVFAKPFPFQQGPLQNGWPT